MNNKPCLFFIFSTITTIFSENANDQIGGAKYIIGGSNSKQGDAPYMVSIRKENMFHVCGGSIIGHRWVLTAAHCIENDINPFYVVVGTNQLDSGGTRYYILRYIQHMWYDTYKNKNDIGLIKTISSIKYTNFVKPILLPWRQVEDGTMLTLTGWGNTQFRSSVPNDLQVANVQVISNEECQRKIPTYSAYLGFTNLCTFSGPGACYGDSGGPLVSDGYVHALVSWSVPECNKTYPDVNVRVNYYKPWILLTKLFYIWR